MISLQRRKTFVILWLAATILAAGIAVSFGDTQEGGVQDDSLPRWLEFLLELELAHIVTHMIIFMVVGLMLGNWNGGSQLLAWQYIVAGAVVMEAIQVIAGATYPSLPAWIWGIGWDLFLDGIGGWLGIWAVGQKLAWNQTRPQ
jgi:hypothetical protein